MTEKAKKVTKVSIVKGIILEAKTEGLEPKDIIARVMTATNFKRGLARVYINGFWDKVLTDAEQAAVAEAAAEAEVETV